jgi:hypothetical protein
MPSKSKHDKEKEKERRHKRSRKGKCKDESSKSDSEPRKSRSEKRVRKEIIVYEKRSSPCSPRSRSCSRPDPCSRSESPKSEKCREKCRPACPALACVVSAIVQAYTLAFCVATRSGGVLSPILVGRILNFYLAIFFRGLELFNNKGCCDPCAVQAYARAVIGFFGGFSRLGTELSEEEINALAAQFLEFLDVNRCKFCDAFRCFLVAPQDRANFVNAGGLFDADPEDLENCCEIGFNLGDDRVDQADLEIEA